MRNTQVIGLKTSAWFALAIFAVCATLVVPTLAESDKIGIEELGRQQFEESMANDVYIEPASTGFGLDNVSAAMTTFACLPSCSAIDGRFLAIASGASLATLSEGELDIQIALPAGTLTFDVGIFDGDADSALGNWDVGSAPFEYTLFADPNRDGSSLTVVAGPFLGAALPNNDWFDTTVATSPAAAAPNGNFFYRLNITNTNPLATVLNSFKVRSTGVSTLEVAQQPFGFYAALQGLADANIIFPAFPATSPTTYDGVFNFFLDVDSVDTELQIWGGDLDRGSFDGTSLDTDDPDTPGAPFLPPWATFDAVHEGVAAGLSGTTGNPADDTDPAGLGIYLQRMPAIVFEVIDPNGATYLNDNPSGNQEWEQFRLTTDPSDPLPADFLVPDLPVGVYRVRASGVDMQNLNFWRFFDPLLCVDELNIPCEPLRSFVIGDEVWLDTDGNGAFDGGEAGIGNVVLELLNAGGNLVETTMTDPNGLYEFQVNAGTFTVQVAASNFDPGGPLAGLVSTTFGESITDTVVNANIPTYDFGYVGGGSIGNFVWLDVNGDGINNEPATAGIGGVTINLTEAGLDGSFGTPDDVFYPAQVTDAAGAYDFTQLPPGNYRVNVDESTLPPSFLSLTTGNEPLDYVLGPSEDFDDADFGYQGPNGLGDLVWRDNNGDGVRQLGEPGIGGVFLSLFDSSGNLIATTTTNGFGVYQFNGLPDGTYRVEVDPATLPAGFAPTFDRDGIGTPHVAANIELQAGDELGQFDSTVDFGYQPANGAIGDTVWRDDNGNGVQDGTEPGIGGVTVTLRDSGGNVVGTDVTDPSGNYGFTGLGADTYTVTVDPATLPAGLVPTFDLDGIGTPNTTSVVLGAGETNNDVDFAYRGTGVIGDRIWNDLNGDGVQDAGELGIGGVTVTLRDSGGNVVGTDLTDGNGNYSFPNLAADTYTVTVDPATLPTGVTTPTFDFDGTGTPNVATVTLGGGETNNDVDFGYQGNSAIGDTVWRDDNGNGVQDGTEPGIGGVTVTLRDSGGNVVGTDVTDPSGNYGFSGLGPDTYTVEVDPSTLPAGFVPTFDFDGTGTPNVATVVLGAGETNNDVDFGYNQPNIGALGDRVWLDSNGDGIQDVGEAGINGVTVNLLDGGGSIIGTQPTSGDGNYGFSGLAAGTYTVQVDASTLPGTLAQTFDLDGLATPNQATVALAAGQTRNEVDFGYAECGACDGKITRLTLQYLGSSAAQVVINAKRGPTTDEVFNATLQPGDVFEIVGPQSGSGGFFGTLGTEINIFVNGVEQTTIHTSCSVPIGPGLIRGDFKVLAGASKNGGALCPIDGMPFCASRADADAFGSTGGHALWLPGISTELVFADNGGVFFERTDGSATLTGTVVDANDSTKRFQVSVDFTGLTTTPPAGSPKKELTAGAYIENGGPVDPSTWRYYTGYTGILTGEGSWDGAQLSIARTGPAFQVGDGASGKNVDFGASGWFDWTVISQPTSGSALPTTGVGDINVDLAEGPCVDECVTVDFDNLATGTIVDNEFAALGMTVTTNDPGAHPAMIFNTASPTGGDTDLGTPNQGFGGPGVGSGGAPGQPGENAVALGKVLIISEDGDSSDPDDNGGGGDLIFTFATPVFIDMVDILDIDEGSGGAVKLYNASGGLIAQIPMQDLGNNSVQTMGINQAGVSKMKVWFPGSGAVSGFTFCPGEPTGGEACTPGFVKDTFNQVSYNNNDGSENWSGDWIENDVAGAGPGSGNISIDNGFLFLEDQPDTGTEPSLARQVDLSGVGTATLRFAFDTSSQVDPSDAIAVEVSNDGGATWTILETITGITGEVNQSRTFDITAFASAQTQVRFRVANLYGGSGEFFCVQWVEVSWTCPGGSGGPGSIAGTVWNDGNGNGIQEDPSTGISGVTVKLKQNGTVFDTTTTDGNGFYGFSGLDAGDYEVAVTTSTLPSGVTVPTYDLDGIGTANQTAVTLAGGQHRDDADFGYQAESTSPCSYCQHYSGHLGGSGERNWQPDGNYYWSGGGGIHEGYLTGVGLDFDLYLYKWNGASWSVVASSTNGGSTEHIDYNGNSGYYVWQVRSHSGSGDYDLYLDHP